MVNSVTTHTAVLIVKFQQSLAAIHFCLQAKFIRVLLEILDMQVSLQHWFLRFSRPHSQEFSQDAIH